MPCLSVARLRSTPPPSASSMTKFSAQIPGTSYRVTLPLHTSENHVNPTPSHRYTGRVLILLPRPWPLSPRDSEAFPQMKRELPQIRQLPPTSSIIFLPHGPRQAAPPGWTAPSPMRRQRCGRLPSLNPAPGQAKRLSTSRTARHPMKNSTV